MFWYSDYLVFCCRNSYILVPPLHPGSSLTSLEQSLRVIRRGCPSSLSPQYDHWIKHNSQFLGYAFFWVNNILQEALWRGSHGEKRRPLASTQEETEALPTTICIILELSKISQPQVTLEMTTALANSLTASSWATLRQK